MTCAICGDELTATGLCISCDFVDDFDADEDDEDEDEFNDDDVHELISSDGFSYLEGEEEEE